MASRFTLWINAKMPIHPSRTLAPNTAPRPKRLRPRWFRLTLFGVSCVIAFVAAGWFLVIPISVWIPGYMIYKIAERRMVASLRSAIWAHVLGGLIALIVISISICVLPSASEFLQHKTVLGFQFSSALARSKLTILATFFLFPIFPIIESNEKWLYRIASAVCAVTASCFSWWLDPDAGLQAAAPGLIIWFVAHVLWNFYGSAVDKASEIEFVWKRHSELQEPHPSGESEYFFTLLAMLEKVIPPGCKASLWIFVPTQKYWRWFNPSTQNLEIAEATPALENILRARRPQWAERTVPAKRADISTKHRLAAMGAAEGVLVPIPIGSTSRTSTDGKLPRLRAIIEVTVSRQTNWLAALSWSMWRAESFPFNLPVVQRTVILIGRLVGLSPDQWVRAVAYRIEPIAPAIDQVLDTWRQSKARQTLETCSSAIWRVSAYNDVINITSAIHYYFDCIATAWFVEQDIKWQLAAQSPTDLALRGFDGLLKAKVDLLKATPPDAASPPIFIKLADADIGNGTLLEHGITDTVLAPIIAQGEVYGCLALLTTRTPDLKPRELNLLSLVASQLGLAFSHLKMMGRYQKMAGNVVGITRLVRGISRRAGTGASTQGMHHAVAKSALEILDADVVILYGLEPRTMQVISICVEGHLIDPDSVMENPLGLDSAVHTIAAHDGPIYASDTMQQFYKSKYRDGKPVFPVRENVASTYASRLVFEGQVIGVLFANYRKRRVFDYQPKDLYKLFASLASHALAISGYHREWLMQTAANERRELLNKIHRDVKGLADALRLNLENLTPITDEPIRKATIERCINRAHDLANELSTQADSLLNLAEDSDWTELYRYGLRRLLAARIARLFNDESLLNFISNYPDGHPLEIYDEKDLLDFGMEAALNSVRHAPGAKMAVRLTLTESEVVLGIQDNGPGIPGNVLDELLASKFNAFKRAASARQFSVANCVGGGLEAKLIVPR